MGDGGAPRPAGRRIAIALILLTPFIGLLYPQWYSKVDPQLSGIPFFVWYQFAWLIFGTFLLVVVYLVRGERGEGT